MLFIKRHWIASVLIGAVISTAISDKVSAVQLKYTFSGIASGSIGDTEYSNEVLSINFIADSDEITSSSLDEEMLTFSTPRMTPTFTLGDISGTFQDQYAIFNNQSSSAVGLTRETVTDPPEFFGFDGDVINVINPELATYNLQRPIGPISATSDFLQFRDQPTTLGRWTINSLVDNTFTAVPEPSTFAGFFPMIGFGLLFCRKIRQKSTKLD